MTFTCRDLEKALTGQSPDLVEELSRHAETCAACRSRLDAWEELSAVARTLHKTWDSPHLWPRICQELESTSPPPLETGPRQYWPELVAWLHAFGWRTAVAGLILLVVSFLGIWMILSRYPSPSRDADWLLTEQALQEIEDREQAYIQSIEKLSALASSRMQFPQTSLMASYREKLLLIDAAIADCRANAAGNRLNAHLRKELLSIYQEKQRTLQQVLKEEYDAKN